MPYREPHLSRDEIEVTLGGLFNVPPGTITSFAIVAVVDDAPRVLTCCEMMHAIQLMGAAITIAADEMGTEQGMTRG